MKYKGTRLAALVQGSRGEYTDLGERMSKYKRPRKNSSGKNYRIECLYNDGLNLQMSTLTALMKETGKPIDFFIDFEPWELPSALGVSGNGNIINSSVSNDMAQRIEHLNEVIHLKNELLTEKDKIVALKDAEIEQWKKRYDDLLSFTQNSNSDTTRT